MLSGSNTPLISIMCNRGIGTIIAILSVLKIHCAYVPVDPSFPVDRQIHIFTHSKSQMLIVDDENYKIVSNYGIQLPPIAVIDSKTGFLTYFPSDNQPVVLNLSDNNVDSNLSIAYVLYTSGSTGKPKGVYYNCYYFNYNYYYMKLLGYGIE